jgi:hypothetical protein
MRYSVNAACSDRAIGLASIPDSTAETRFSSIDSWLGWPTGILEDVRICASLTSFRSYISRLDTWLTTRSCQSCIYPNSLATFMIQKKKSYYWTLLKLIENVLASRPTSMRLRNVSRKFATGISIYLIPVWVYVVSDSVYGMHSVISFVQCRIRHYFAF